ncbi:MAG: hypothetical protein JW745_02270 [Sedimentisphaerales bacterium]|nr:hypothetical protein [Sedimentisphaerales bacterium]
MTIVWGIEIRERRDCVLLGQPQITPYRKRIISDSLFGVQERTPLMTTMI